jgi:peptidoglycan hydrolase CwlO-like protein
LDEIERRAAESEQRKLYDDAMKAQAIIQEIKTDFGDLTNEINDLNLKISKVENNTKKLKAKLPSLDKEVIERIKVEITDPLEELNQEVNSEERSRKTESLA